MRIGAGRFAPVAAIGLLGLGPSISADAGDGGAGPKSPGLSRRFEREIWPLMTRPADASKACVACHRDDGSNTSDFVLPGEPEEAFEALLDGGYFDRENPNSLLSRIGRKSAEKRMPPEPGTPWSASEVKRLEAFVKALEAQR